MQLQTLRAFITANPILAAATSSLWGAMLVDVIVFLRSKTPGDFFGQFNPKLALWRYAQALVGGFLGNAVVAAGASLVAFSLYSWFR